MWHEVLEKLVAIDRRLERIENLLVQQGVTLMPLIDDITQSVATNTTLDGSIIQLLSNISAQLAAAGTDQGKLAALKTQIDANNQAIADAIKANTPAAPPPAPAPAPPPATP